MSDEHLIGADLRGVLQDLAGRLERLEQRNARTDNVLLDMNKVDEARIDIIEACDHLGDDVQGAIESTFCGVADALELKIAEG